MALAVLSTMHYRVKLARFCTLIGDRFDNNTLLRWRRTHVRYFKNVCAAGKRFVPVEV